MIFVRFFSQPNGNLTGFVMQVHANFADFGFDTVCAAVSSAAYMTVNTVTEILKAEAEITVDDGRMYMQVADFDVGRCRDLLLGFKLHLLALEEQYPNCMQVDYMEV